MVSTTLSTRVSSSSTSTTPAMEGEKKHPYPTTEVTSAPYNHLDENAVALELASNPTHPITAADTTRVLRKIDLYLMPLKCLAVLLQFLDKTSLNYASLLGLKKDTHLHGQQYSWLAFMPDSPATIRYLTTRERQIAVHRIKSNKSGIHDKKFKKNQLIEAVKDFRLYIFFVAICAANIANGGVSNFGSEIISQFGYDSKTTSLLGMAPGAMEVVAVYFGAWLSHVTHTRVIPGVLMYILAIVGGVMMIAIPSTSSAGRYSGYVICFTYPVASPFIYSFLSSSVSGTTKRIVFNMVLQVGYSVGNLIGPQTYRVKDAPGYVLAKITLVVVFGVAAACLVGIGGVHARWNRRNGLGGWKDVVSAGEDGMEGEEEGKREVDDGEDLSDLTDKQRSKFRYPY
ncbi:probable DAL5 - Allantoate and ureidosuccinate permease [Ustilago sp. UG-2017b]|nr:probable DAL5 - Allantoate and ureidosuccinate permease [Ustilago sp. UG-2017b]